MNRTNQPSAADWPNLILGLTLLLGFLVRFFPGLLAGFPLNDGGMFLTMIQDLRDNAFRLPAFTTYNQAHIPFAYPPLGFYVGAFLSRLGIPALQVLRWLPPLVNFFAILAFYWLAYSLTRDRSRAAVASMVFALVPGSFSWQIMGGGLTRAWGMFFILLANASVYWLFQQGKWKYVWLSVLFCSLAVLSHPEVSLATAASCALFWAFFGRTRRGTLQAALVALGTLLLTFAWWGKVWAYHGLQPFLTVMHSGAYIMNPLVELGRDVFTLDVWTGLFHILVLLGLVWTIRQRRFFYLAWLALPYFTEPRSAPAFAHFPESILAALALLEAFPAWLQRWATTPDRMRWGRRWIVFRLQSNPASLTDTPVYQQRGFTLALFGLGFLWFLQSAFFGLLMVNTSLIPPAPQQAMEWVRQATPPDSRFVILSGEKGVMTDPIQEWFPALSGRQSQSTLQGLEWTLGEQFFPRLRQLQQLQACREISCVEQWSDETGLRYSHVLILKTPHMAGMIRSAQEGGYSLLFENEAVVILRR